MENKIMPEIIPKLVEIELENYNLLEKFNNEIHIEFVKEKIDGDESMISYEGRWAFDCRMRSVTYSIIIFGQAVDTITLSNEICYGYPRLQSGQELYEYNKDKWNKIISSIFSSEKLSRIMSEKFNIKKDDFYLNREIDINNIYTMKEIKKILDTTLSNIERLESQKREKTIEFDKYIKETDEKINKEKADIEKYKPLLEQREKEIEAQTDEKQKEMGNIYSLINNIDLSKYSLDDLRKLTSVITDVTNPKVIDETDEKFNIKKDDFYLNREIDINNIYTVKEIKKILDTILSNIEWLESQKRKKTIEFNKYIKETDEKINKEKADIEKYKPLLEQREKEIENAQKKLEREEKQKEIGNIYSSINNIDLFNYSLDDLRKLTLVITDVTNPKVIDETEDLSRKI